MIDTNKTIISFDYNGTMTDEISRNLSTLYSTVEGSVPLDRSFGLSSEYISYPLPVAENMIALDIVEKTEIYEPRAEVREVTFEHDIDGQLIPRVLIGRADNDEAEEGDEI